MLIFIKPSKTSLIASIISEIDPAHDEGVFKEQYKGSRGRGLHFMPRPHKTLVQNGNSMF